MRVVVSSIPCTSITRSWHHLCLGALWTWLVLAPVLQAAADPSPLPKEPESPWRFSILPKSLQKNPLIDQTVVTEMTDEGRKLPAPTAENPAYYVAVPAGLHNEGFATDSDHPPSNAILADCLQRALAINHFLPSGPDHPPTLLISYLWGVHNNLDQGSDEIGVASPDIGHRNLLSRAALVGGTKFAAELKAVLEADDREISSGAPRIMLLDPLKLFVERDARTRQLFALSSGQCYYLVASAYDYQAAARKEGRKLLWRSKMTVDSSGMAMADTLPTLVLNAGIYLGRDMPEAATLLRRSNRNTEVILAPMEVKEYLDRASPVQPETKKP